MHPPFTVEIDVANHWKHTHIGNSPFPTKPEDGEERQVVKLASGHALRKLEPHPHPYHVDFGAGAIDVILADRAAARAMEKVHATTGEAFSPITTMNFNQIVARHLQDAAMVAHSPLDQWTAIRVRAPTGFNDLLKADYGLNTPLEAFLQMYFDLPGEEA